jgi:tetratricopeptide (TPR) repeat protein
VATLLVLLALSVAIAYGNSLAGPFVLDDQASIVQNPDIHDLSRLGSVLAPRPDSPVAGRPLASLSFALNYAAGGLDVTGYHIVNVALHMTCALLAFGLIRRTLGLRGVGLPGAARPEELAFGAVLLWAVHPLNTEVVDYLTQRTESLAAAFVLSTLLASLLAATSRSGGRWAASAVAACALGTATKESTAIAPVLVVLYDRAFLFESWRDTFHARWRFYLALASTWLLAAVLVTSGGRSAVAGFSAGVSPWIYLLNQSQMVTEYLRLSVWPRDLVAFYGWPVELTFTQVVPQFALLTVLVLAVVVVYVRAPRLGFLGAWFFITLAPASSLVPVATEVGAERRMYLPLMALTVLALVGSMTAWGRWRPERRSAFVPAVVLVVTCVALAWATIRRNGEYASALTLVRSVVERRPTSVAHHMLGEQQLLAGRIEEGIAELRTAVSKGNSKAGYQLGVALINAQRPDEALDVLTAFVATERPPRPLVPRWLEPTTVEVVTARGLMAQVLGGRREWGLMADQATEMLRAAPTHPGARRLLADARFGQERWAEAASDYRRYLEVRAEDAGAWINLGIASVATGRIDDAVDAFARAAAVEPGNERAQRLLGLAREDRAKITGAR